MSSSHPRQSSVDLDSPGRPFDNIINFRDVGRTINQLIGKRYADLFILLNVLVI